MEITPTTTTADLYLTNSCLRAQLPMLGFTRLSDLLNNMAGLFLRGALLGTGSATSGAALAAEGLERDFVVRLLDVLFICPLADGTSGASPSTAERRDRLQQRMVLQLDGWRITGSLHLVDHVPWIDFATSANTRFIAVTDAVIGPPGGPEPIVCSFVLVNGARLSAIYEDEHAA